ncbi:hypothetical protein TPHA_0D00980 [Tetrapisispora phaffii CBS 4417]|uniref:Mitochondrial aspartate-glutamate transporter AGC1 n=1 Tax=Tetrapisispora phaffii (strain ATCC 24235 / CBS 4417 / NBRC 1672 / NRRL Y-8282 / UCD 70-5) TaxID=1071381 RepID=G8BSB8_TETPH|nr:hypothetical protein TPHA_0D00980 [Tetrapisispora phaffii CBS 4417]CCE62739.1 hypothetical protein TPHA_0D00980 [Tetrapisispora phaffii CBS 4417]
MELINSMSSKRARQVEIFKRFAHVIDEDQKRLPPYEYELTDADQFQEKTGDLILTYNDFIHLITSSQSLHSAFTDHSFNLNIIPNATFGCIFFALDTDNKGYLTINDWFHFNNLLAFDNYQYILLFEFFKKFDKAFLEREGIKMNAINYGDKSLSFDNLLINFNQLKHVLNFLQDQVLRNSDKDAHIDFIRRNKLVLDWNNLPFLKYYEYYCDGKRLGLPMNDVLPYISLNSMITMMQNDLKNEKLRLGFEKLSHADKRFNNTLTINKNQLVYLLKLFFAHRISQDVFDSLNFTNNSLISSDNNHITYNVIKDIFYLFQHFDLLNQALVKYVTVNDLSDSALREHEISKQVLNEILNCKYNKVNNIIQFSPSQINILFSVVANAKQKNKKKTKGEIKHHHKDSHIDDFISNEYSHGNNISKRQLEIFNAYYQDMANAVDDEEDIYCDKDDRGNNGFLEFVLQFYSSGNIGQNATKGNYLTIEDFMKIINPNYLNNLVHSMEIKRLQQNSLYSTYYFFPIFDSLYNFGLGSIAGCIGATIVYPIDMVKTRMQAQRAVSRYTSYFNCFTKIISREGFKGLYSGIGPQLVGVAPEKAIKLTVNDFMRNKLTDSRTGKIHINNEILSGATAGMCQVIFTNPLEIVKIRLQVKSEYATTAAKDITAISIVRQLRVTGLYKGVVACLSRDVPFSAVYFPTYSHIKKDIFNFDPCDKTKKHSLKTWELLLAGALAGMPAAFLTTPFDVIKTRLQMDPRKGETKYNGIFHAAQTILREESFKSFFKGGGARVLRSSPQFGFTLAAYEMFKNLFPMSQDGHIGSNNINSNQPLSGPSNTANKDEIPSITSSFKNVANAQNSSVRIQSSLLRDVVDPYSNTYVNYYYKSCEIAKVFLDLDNNFSSFDSNMYYRFYDEIKNSQQ